MAQNISFKNICILMLTLPLMLILMVGIYFLSDKFRFLPKGTLVEEIYSLNKHYVAKSYFIDGGSLSGNAVRVEIMNVNTKKSKTIYYSYPENEVVIKWEDDDYIIINEIRLNIHKDKYYNSSLLS